MQPWIAPFAVRDGASHSWSPHPLLAPELDQFGWGSRPDPGTVATYSATRAVQLVNHEEHCPTVNQGAECMVWSATWSWRAEVWKTFCSPTERRLSTPDYSSIISSIRHVFPRVFQPKLQASKPLVPLLISHSSLPLSECFVRDASEKNAKNTSIAPT